MSPPIIWLLSAVLGFLASIGLLIHTDAPDSVWILSLGSYALMVISHYSAYREEKDWYENLDKGHKKH